MNKKEYEKWVIKAEETLQSSNLFKDAARQKIYKGYNGQISALGISIWMSGLLPTLAIYYQHQPEGGNGACRKNVLEVIAKMLGNNETARTLLEKVLDLEQQKKEAMDAQDREETKRIEKELDNLKNAIVDSSVALKQVVRTYKLED